MKKNTKIVRIVLFVALYLLFFLIFFFCAAVFLAAGTNGDKQLSGIGVVIIVFLPAIISFFLSRVMAVNTQLKEFAKKHANISDFPKDYNSLTLAAQRYSQSANSSTLISGFIKSWAKLILLLNKLRYKGLHGGNNTAGSDLLRLGRKQQAIYRAAIERFCAFYGEQIKLGEISEMENFDAEISLLAPLLDKKTSELVVGKRKELLAVLIEYKEKHPDTILTDDGRYDFNNFSEAERTRVIDVINYTKETYYPNEFALGLCNESNGVLYKPRYVLFEIIIQLYKNSPHLDDLLAVALAYSTQGAASRQKAIEYFEKSAFRIPYTIFSKYPAISDLFVFSTFMKIYEAEHLYREALQCAFTAFSAPGANPDFFKLKIDELQKKLQNPKPKRQYKPDARNQQLAADVSTAARHFITVCGLRELDNGIHDDENDEYELDGGETPFDRIDYMNGPEFEKWCAELLKKNGFENVEINAKSGDQGVDILAEKGDVTYAIQCKCYSHDLGNTPVQEVATGRVIYHRHIAAVMTNRHFTKGGKDAAEATGVLLWDRDKLLAMYNAANELTTAES